MRTNYRMERESGKGWEGQEQSFMFIVHLLLNYVPFSLRPIQSSVRRRRRKKQRKNRRKKFTLPILSMKKCLLYMDVHRCGFNNRMLTLVSNKIFPCSLFIPFSKRNMHVCTFLLVIVSLERKWKEGIKKRKRFGGRHHVKLIYLES